MGLNNKSEEKKLITVLILGFMIFSVTAIFVTTGNAKSFDDGIRFWAYDCRNPVLSRFFITITYMGNWQVITLIALALILYGKTRKNIGLPFAITSIISTVIYKLVKMGFQRPRPDLVYRIIEQGGFSFPSGHSMNGLVCYGILIYLIRKNCSDRKLANAFTLGLSVLIVLIGISRVYVGVHFPTDIIGGWSLGATVLAAAILIQEKRRKN